MNCISQAIPLKNLFLYEEIMLLALRDDKGTISTNMWKYTVAGAVLAELLLMGRILVEDDRKQRVLLKDSVPTGDPVIDECFEIIKAGKRPASLKTWVTRLARIKNLHHKVAGKLCKRGILRADEDKILHIFTRNIYPELNPEPEKEILQRMRDAIFGETISVDPRTVILISLANGADLLSRNLGRKEIRGYRKRIENIVNGEVTGKAAREVIAACRAAAMVAVIMPAVIVGSSH